MIFHLNRSRNGNISVHVTDRERAAVRCLAAHRTIGTAEDSGDDDRENGKETLIRWRISKIDANEGRT